jgi:hypothetical protein
VPAEAQLSNLSEPEWLSLANAVERFSDTEAWRRFIEVENECIKNRWILEHLGAEQSKLSFDRDDPKDVAHLDGLEKRSAAWKPIEAAFLKKLQSGEIIARAYAQPVRPDSTRIEIKSDMWGGVLRPFFVNGSAIANDFRLEGVQVRARNESAEGATGLEIENAAPEARDEKKKPTADRNKLLYAAAIEFKQQKPSRTWQQLAELALRKTKIHMKVETAKRTLKRMNDEGKI